MTAAALVVSQACAGAGAAVPHAVLQGVCALPVEHLNGSAMRDVVFAWHWIVASGARTLYRYFRVRSAGLDIWG